MPRTIRYHLDETSSRKALAAALRRTGIDVTTTTEVGLRGASDPAQLTHAHVQGRVLFTEDQDSLALHAAGQEHAGIAYCHQTKYRLGEIIRQLVLLWEVYEPDELRNRVEYL